MSFYLKFARVRTAQRVLKAEAAETYHDPLPEADAVRIEAVRRANVENASVAAMGGHRMSPGEFADRVAEHSAIVQRERAALAAAQARASRDPVLTSKPPPPRLRADGDTPPGKAKGRRPTPAAVLDAPPPPPKRRDDGEAAVVKADQPVPRRKVVLPRSQRIKKQGIDQRDLDLSRPADVAAAVRAAALRNRRK